jgi:predicted porin
MKKNLIAVAVAAAFIAPSVSMAEVTAYGQAQVEVYQTTHEDEAVAGADDGLGIIDNARGRVGLKATEDLGDGWTGLAKFEFKADTADGTSKGDAALTGRETMVGLKGPMGQIELGSLKQAYKYTGGVNYDIFVTTEMEARGNGGMTAKPGNFAGGGHSAFHTNAVGYRNSFGPVKLSLTYGPSLDDGSYTLSLMYAQGGIEAFVAAADSADLAGTGNSYTATKVGGKFSTGAHSIMLQMENTDVENGGSTISPSFMYLAYQMKMGPNIFVVQYGTMDGDAPDADLTYTALGAVHKMSKETRIYGGWRGTTSDDDTRESVITIGLRKDFAS